MEVLIPIPVQMADGIDSILLRKRADAHENAIFSIFEVILLTESIPALEPIPAQESIPLWNRFHAVPIPILLAKVPVPIPVP